MPLGSRHRRLLLALLPILGGALLAMWLAHGWAGRRTLQSESVQLERQLELHSQALQQRIDRYRTLPQVLAQDPQLHLALAMGVDDAGRDALNRRLEAANSVTRSSTQFSPCSPGSSWRAEHPAARSTVKTKRGNACASIHRPGMSAPRTRLGAHSVPCVDRPWAV